jgi:hypothetical protein
MVSKFQCFGISVAAIIVAVLISGCVQQPGVEPVVPGTTPAVSPPTTIPGTTPAITPPTVPPTPPEPATFDVKISSLSCAWTVKTGDYGVKSDCVRIIAQGTARGPVGARLELPILAWSTDKFNCGGWTFKTGALIAVGSTCVRKEGQPESTSWTADTGSDNCPLKNYFNNQRSYTVNIYKDDDLTPQKTDSRGAVCQ